jgi:DNA-binding MarR family transcriptional regulator/ribosomal protein S18 acetylase RimI-like enzyme
VTSLRLNCSNVTSLQSGRRASCVGDLPPPGFSDYGQRMDEAAIGQVRRFNRTVTQRVGALNDHFLGGDRPLGAARLLWEIGADGRDLRSLRADLGLDSGYLSRLLRSLEADGLVALDADPADRRVRVVRLTAAGRAERDALDRRSDAAAAAMLEPLTVRQRERLVAAMAEVELLLRAAAVDVAETDPAHPDAQTCLQAYYAELRTRFANGFDPALSTLSSESQMRPPEGLLLVARLGAEPVGCGALRFHGGPDGQKVCEVKRMWVAQHARGLGLGRRLLRELEARAVGHRARLLRLETNAALREAITLYLSAGFVEVAPYNDETYADHWFEKDLASPNPNMV